VFLYKSESSEKFKTRIKTTEIPAKKIRIRVNKLFKKPKLIDFENVMIRSDDRMKIFATMNTLAKIILKSFWFKISETSKEIIPDTDTNKINEKERKAFLFLLKKLINIRRVVIENIVKVIMFPVLFSNPGYTTF